MNRRPNLKKRAAILEAALEEFQLSGYQGANMDTIAERAQVSKRTVYNHFPSKQSLFEHIAETVWEQANAATQAQFDPSRPIHTQLTDLARKELALVSDPQFLRSTRMLMSELLNNEAVAQATLAKYAEEESNIALWMAEAAKAQCLNCSPSEAEQVGKEFHGLVKSLAFWPQLFMGEVPVATSQHTDVAEKVATMFLSIYGQH